MFSRTRVDFYIVMTASLAFLEVLTALKIDNQLAVIRNDCYERLAIGHRHNSKDIYKTSNVTRVLDCQLFCTEEKELCKSFSFGIGVKGNASCELSADTVKETADLKPVGTIVDIDYDLYIKKLGCTLVIDKDNPAFNHYNPQYKPSDSYGKPQNGVSPGFEKPATPVSKPVNAGYGPSTAGSIYGKPQTETQHVQTLVSVSSGPHKPVLDNYQNILIGEGPYHYARPPFRPPFLNHPYDNPSRPRPDDYGSRPHFDYDSHPGESNWVPYGHRPIPDKYGSYIPRPDHYNDYYHRPKPDNYQRPDYYKPHPPDDAYIPRPRPPVDYNRPHNPTDGYNQRPVRPNNEFVPIGSSDYDRPILSSDIYNQRPHRPDRPTDYDKPRPPSSGYDRPYGPDRPADYDKPRPPSSGYDRPNLLGPYGPDRPADYDKPRPPSSGYDRPNPLGPYGPDRPTDYDKPRPPSSGYDRPNPLRPYGPDRPADYDKPRPPSSGYDRPNPLGPYGPDRPTDYDEPRPPSNGYDKPNPLGPYKPDRPNDYNTKPRPPNSDYDPSNVYNQRPHRPDRPIDYNEKPRPPRPSSPSNVYNEGPTDFDRPNNYNQRPRPPSSDYDRPILSPNSGNNRPNPPNSYESNNLPNNGYDRPGEYEKPKPPSNGYDGPTTPNTNYNKPQSDYNQKPASTNNRPPIDDYYPSKPTNEYLFHSEIDRYDKPNNSIKDGSAPHSKPIVTQSTGSHGESITSIITELEDSCFRRVLAGKRVTRALVKRALFCERVEDCQRECAEEKRFTCEGFNYRLDPAGRGKGECELLAIPLSRLDIGRDLYPDRDYDYYERDRNAASMNCRGHGYYSDYGSDGDYNRQQGLRPYDWWNDDRRYGSRRPRPDYDSRPSYDYDGYRPNSNRRGDFAYHDSHHSEHSHNYHYQHYDHGAPPYDYKSYEPYLPVRRPFYEEDRYFNKYFIDRDRDKSYWFPKPTWGSYGGSYGTNYNTHDFERRNYYLPPPREGNKNWGQYGGTYGTGGLNLHYNGYGHSQSFDFWGLNKYEEKFHNYGELPPPKRPPNGGSYLPERPQKFSGSYIPDHPHTFPSSHNVGYLPELPQTRPGGSYLPEPELKPPIRNGGESYLPERPYRPPGNLYDKPNHNNAILPAEPRYTYYYDFLKEECSLRSAAGFRLHKGIVKKYISVPNIYECELLCFKEKEFPCASYAYRYTPASNENCYLSNRNYKELDFYTDLQPDRNFDVYTMNNMKRCEQPVVRERDNSDCFWRVRSAQRFDHKIVLDSLFVKSIVDCQIQCLRSTRFTCRAFSFRYGSPTIGGPADNCLLTDWPYYEMDPKIHFVPEPGYEIYERGSFGHGCEAHHFGVIGKPVKSSVTRIDQLCYIGLGTAARLLRQATKKELQVATEEECKAQCSNLRENTLFQCMSLSYNTRAPKWEPNCLLSDILQRDLLPNVDYEPNPDSWLFSWDNYNPRCKAIANDAVHNTIGRPESRHDYDVNAIGTWKVYSVSGWPCRRGTLCKENTVAGFWYCELEGGEANAWDYCCRPDHQCGFSEGFQYQWCYVGPQRTQWRKCSDKYYPYIHNIIDRFDRPPHGPSNWNPTGTNHYLPDHPTQGPSNWIPNGNYYLPDHKPPPPQHYLPDQRPQFQRPGVRPDRPPAPPTPPPPTPSLDEYEMQFENQFLDPPKPGGFGQPRHWPLSYLHKEMPPNTEADTDSRLMKVAKSDNINPKYAAIQNLIDVIKSNDLKNVQYQITNESNKADDILFVKIPLPTNFTEETKSEKIIANTTSPIDVIDVKTETKKTRRSQKSLPIQDRLTPVYRRSFITRTNITRSSRRL